MQAHTDHRHVAVGGATSQSAGLGKSCQAMLDPALVLAAVLDPALVLAVVLDLALVLAVVVPSKAVKPQMHLLLRRCLRMI